MLAQADNRAMHKFSPQFGGSGRLYFDLDRTGQGCLQKLVRHNCSREHGGEFLRLYLVKRCGELIVHSADAIVVAKQVTAATAARYSANEVPIHFEAAPLQLIRFRQPADRSSWRQLELQILGLMP
jgi:hypothetical protein